MVKQMQSTLRALPRRDHGSGQLDAAKLSSALRELALKAHRLVRAMNGTGPRVEGAVEELADLHTEIVRLQRNLGSHQLDELATYVSALRERVEEYLP